VLFGLSQLEASEKIRRCSDDNEMVLVILRKSPNESPPRRISSVPAPFEAKEDANATPTKETEPVPEPGQPSEFTEKKVNIVRSSIV